MDIEFRKEPDTDTPRVIARIVEQDKLPHGLPMAIAEGAKATRFSGKPGQVFDGFAENEGQLVRLALAGAGKVNVESRHAALEKAGAALTAKYLTSGESAIAIDAGASDLNAEETAAVLLGARLRAWRWDHYRTRLRDEQKRTLTKIVVIGAPDGTEAEWEDAQAVATGVEFTRELVAEPANVIYPETFVERCNKRFEGTGAELVVLDDAEMEKLGMGALLGVGLGSERPSRLLAIKWMGGKADESYRPVWKT